MRLDKVDKEGGDVTKLFYNRESGPPATPGAISTYWGEEAIYARVPKMEKGDSAVPLLVALACSVDFSVEESTAGCTGIAANPQFPNFTIALRVSVELLVTTAGPPLKKCQAEYCSMYGSSDDRQSIGTITL